MGNLACECSVSISVTTFHGSNEFIFCSQELGIPSDATLLYTVELLNVDMPTEIEAIPISERISLA